MDNNITLTLSTEEIRDLLEVTLSRHKYESRFRMDWSFEVDRNGLFTWVNKKIKGLLVYATPYWEGCGEKIPVSIHLLTDVEDIELDMSSVQFEVTAGDITDFYLDEMEEMLKHAEACYKEHCEEDAVKKKIQDLVHWLSQPNPDFDKVVLMHAVMGLKVDPTGSEALKTCVKQQLLGGKV